MNILLTGATGFIGNAVLRHLLQQGHQITACCRHPDRLLSESPLLTRLTMDFSTSHRVENWLPHLDGIDAVINCVGIIAETRNATFADVHRQAPIALFQAAVQAGVGKVLQISALGADEQAVSAYHLSKKAADDALRALPVVWFVLQPSVVYGPGAQSTALFHALAALPVLVLPDGGRQLFQPIHVDDVAEAVCRCLAANPSGGATLALVGPKPIAYVDWMRGLRRRLGKPAAAAWQLPAGYASRLADLAQWLGEPILSRDNLAMLDRGNHADVQPITRLLGRAPREFTEALLVQPATQAERWQAELYFLRPVLQFAIVLVWVWSGLTSLLFYPHELSYRLLSDCGISGVAAPLTLYALAAMDIGLGLATLMHFRLKSLLLWQFWIVLAYSVLVAWRLPEFVFHPFGPLLKNLPFLLCLLIYRHLQGESS